MVIPGSGATGGFVLGTSFPADSAQRRTDGSFNDENCRGLHMVRVETNTAPQELKCSFCGKKQSEVKRLMSNISVVSSNSPGPYICDGCVELYHLSVIEELKEEETVDLRQSGSDEIH
jgi:hypothetical protein